MGIHKYTLTDLRRFNDIESWVCDNNIDIPLIKEYMETYEYLKTKIEKNIQIDKTIWLCQSCRLLLEEDTSVQCKRCLDWLHLKCEKLSEEPKEDLNFANRVQNGNNYLCMLIHLKKSM